MIYAIRWEREASKAMRRLATHDPSRAQQIVERVEQLAREEASDIVKLAGRQERWRLRVGSWRVILGTTTKHGRLSWRSSRRGVAPTGSAPRRRRLQSVSS